MAFHGWPLAQCQAKNTPLHMQLLTGIRVIDVRLSLKDGQLMAYHDVVPQRATFQSILTTLHDFLRGPESPGRRETVVMSLKQEDYKTVDAHLFSRTVRAEMAAAPGGLDLWFLDARVPLLGEARGRAVLLSRFGVDGAEWPRGLDGLGIHPRSWPDSAPDGFTWDCAGTLVRTHDWYRIPSFLAIPEKAARATAVLLQPEHAPVPVLNISYTSASSFPLAFPPTVARGFGWPRQGFGVEGVNARVGRWLAGQLAGVRGPMVIDEKAAAVEKDAEEVAVDEPRVRGWVLMDYYREPMQDLVPLLIEMNFRGRKSGEEGWP